MPRRAIVLVLDGCGAGEAPDAPDFGDNDHPHTLRHVLESAGAIVAPHLSAMGFLASAGIPASHENARYGRMRELSVGGKDSVTGHWEMMGVVTDRPFPTYPNGFPIPLVKEFERRIGTQTLANRPASGTQIIADLGAQHMETGFPILYTSADSVFQLACHEKVVPLDKLYEFCRIAREICVAPNNVQRVIARPFIGNPTEGFQRTEHRKDFPLSPPPNLVDQIGDVVGIGVVPELFGGRGFRPAQRTQNNAQHWNALKSGLESDSRFIFGNFEDFDMLYGHRNDPHGFAKCLEEFDQHLGDLISNLAGDDLLLLTADHGNDPTTPSTDHSREFVPAAVLASGLPGKNLGDVPGMTAVGATVARWLGVDWTIGTPLID
jgi:phosphopentomutase